MWSMHAKVCQKGRLLVKGGGVHGEGETHNSRCENLHQGANKAYHILLYDIIHHLGQVRSHSSGSLSVTSHFIAEVLSGSGDIAQVFTLHLSEP